MQVQYRTEAGYHCKQTEQKCVSLLKQYKTSNDYKNLMSSLMEKHCFLFLGFKNNIKNFLLNTQNDEKMKNFIKICLKRVRKLSNGIKIPATAMILSFKISLEKLFPKISIF